MAKPQRPDRDERDWYTLAEAATLLQVHTSTAAKQLRDHNVPFVRRSNGRFEINKKGLMRYIHGAGVEYR